MNTFMLEALNEAKKAFRKNEVPIGAVIVRDNIIIAKSHNLCEFEKNSTKHAEINAIDIACKKLNSKTLDDCEIYVTAEPCPMCAGAISHTRIKRVYIGCQEPKTGAFGTKINICDIMPHKCEIYFGFCEDESKELLRKFFEVKR